MSRHHPRHPASAVAGILAAALIGLASLPAAAATTWTATATKAVTLASSVTTTAAPDAMPMHVTLSLKIQNKAALDQLVKNQATPGTPQFGARLTPDQFVAAYSPSAAQASTVANYLKSAGFSNVKIGAGRLLVTGDATAAIANKAFNTRISQFQFNGRNVYAPTLDAQVPTSLGGVVLAVGGLQNVVQMQTALSQARQQLPTWQKAAAASRTPVKTAAASSSSSGGSSGSSSGSSGASGSSSSGAGSPTVIGAFTPTQFPIAYDQVGVPQGSNTVIAVSTYGDDGSGVINDLRTAEKNNTMPYVPVEVRLQAPIPAADADTAGDDEWDLDTQFSTGMAGNVKKLVIYGDDDTVVDNLLWEYEDFADAGCQSCTLDGNPNVATEDVALVGNMSYGSCDAINPVTGGLLLPSISSSDQLFEQAVAEGRSWHASTGDDGGACSPVNALGLPDAGIPGGANYPASSPYVVAVGGTTLFTDANYNFAEEIAWLSGGGGISAVESAPSWQSGIVPSATLGSNVPAGRGVPDVSMNAGLYVPEAVVEQGAQVVVNGSTESVVGTSLSSPLAVGAWARFETARCNDPGLGFAAQAYYALDTGGGPLSTATGFNDTLIGSNGFYVATPGWDYTTGFGSIDLAKVNAALPPAPSGCGALSTPPTAKLSADHKSGKAPLNVDFSGSASSGSSGKSLSYYALDFGDGSQITVQPSATFAAHAYTAPGTYTASLTVRNSDGVVSAPVTVSISVTGTPPSCSGLGEQVVTVPSTLAAGTEGVDLGMGADDMVATYIAEPGALSNQLVVTMQVKELSSVPPGFRWVTYFNIPEDNNNYYVAMDSATGTPEYTYGIRGLIPIEGASDFTVLGTLDASSTETGDANGGLITLVYDTTASPGIPFKVGDTLSNIVSATRITAPNDPTGTLPGGEGLTQQSAGATVGYTVVGNAECLALAGTSSSSSGGGSSSSSSGGTGGSSSSGGTGSGGGSGGGGGAIGGGALLPLLLAALGRRRRKA